MELVEFLLARITEDQAAATERTQTVNDPAPFGEVMFLDGRVYHEEVDVTDAYAEWVDSLPLSNRARRVRAECEAKRRIVERFTSSAAWAEHPSCPHPDVYRNIAGTVLDVCRDLALPYADHPDYREEWRPRADA